MKYKDIFNFSILENIELTSGLQLPVINGSQNVPKSVISFNYAKTCKCPEEQYVHFYIDDYQFERVWRKPKLYTIILSKFKGIIAPDFSTYTNMPKALQIYQIYKSRLLCAYWQRLGLDVIPNISWSDYDSLLWTLEGIPMHSVVAISTNGVLNKKTRDNFIQCYKKAIEILQPTKVVIVGEVPTEIQSNLIVNFPNRINYLRKLSKEV